MNSTAIAPIDSAIADVEDAMAVLFTRAGATWRDFAACVHPELQPAGYKILSALVRLGPTSSGALADLLFTDKSVMSRQVRWLQANGLVESHQDPGDGRVRVVAVTTDACSRVEHARSDNMEMFRDQLRQWPREDLSRFADMIERLGE
ncbi:MULTISPECIES: MarR family winged helix-turn-helix transcriptional regulator [unclassified Leifsonia]|uniref:MarR family winged helix-turn-helix transcriptional regulator n=1 Tax=unclassified Leifsonia TaxID=2663824 RepID=UPI0006F318EE|nr:MULTISPECIES: MarR family winged helix-turn-helix transcriptional regulator [unclassified Leifsonia]KQX05487.1 hypothetical protein ASC59_15315 [Leifsonia sp. Root1293]KRA09120.1 hypothetical protein ASD61_15310 [Leifsonia sp. Root60]